MNTCLMCRQKALSFSHKNVFCMSIKRAMLLLLIAFLSGEITTLQASSPRSQKRVQRIVEQISFGRTETEVLALLSETVDIKEDRSVNVTELFRFEYLHKILEEAASYDSDTEQWTIPSEVVKKYVVKDCAALWPQNYRMEFYFMRPYGSSEPFLLFAIRSMIKLEISSAAAVFNKYVDIGKKNRHSKEPIVVNTAYHSASGAELLTKVALWDMTTTRDYLFVPDNGYYVFPEFLYVDKLDMKLAMDAARKCKAALKKREP